MESKFENFLDHDILRKYCFVKQNGNPTEFGAAINYIKQRAHTAFKGH